MGRLRRAMGIQAHKATVAPGKRVQDASLRMSQCVCVGGPISRRPCGREGVRDQGRHEPCLADHLVGKMLDPKIQGRRTEGGPQPLPPSPCSKQMRRFTYGRRARNAPHALQSHEEAVVPPPSLRLGQTCVRTAVRPFLPCLLGSAAAVSRHCCASGHGFWRGLRRTTTTLTKQGRARAARRYRVALAALPSSPPHKIAQSHSRTPLPPLFSARCEGKLRSQPPPSVPLAALTEGGALAKQTKVLVQPQPATSTQPAKCDSIFDCSLADEASLAPRRLGNCRASK